MVILLVTQTPNGSVTKLLVTQTPNNSVAMLLVTQTQIEVWQSYLGSQTEPIGSVTMFLVTQNIMKV